MEVDHVWFGLVVAVDDQAGQVEPTVGVVGRGNYTFLLPPVCQDPSSHPDAVRPSPAGVQIQKSTRQSNLNVFGLKTEIEEKSPCSPPNLVVWSLVLFEGVLVLLLD